MKVLLFSKTEMNHYFTVEIFCHSPDPLLCGKAPKPNPVTLIGA